MKHNHVPDDEELNRLLCRSESELDLFESFGVARSPPLGRGSKAKPKSKKAAKDRDRKQEHAPRFLFCL